jgi:hypothetical protein
LNANQKKISSIIFEKRITQVFPLFQACGSELAHPDRMVRDTNKTLEPQIVLLTSLEV